MMFKKHTRFSRRSKKAYILPVLIISNIAIISFALSLGISRADSPEKFAVLGEEVVSSSEVILDGGEEVAQNTPTKKLTISIHTVQKGETLSGIAEEYGISVNTIRWANELSPRATIKEGQELTILPVTGIEYKVGKGDSLISIAKKYNSNVDEIREVNDLDGSSIKIGQVLIIPDAMPLTIQEVKKQLPPPPTPHVITSQQTVPVVQQESKPEPEEKEVSVSLDNFPFPLEIVRDEKNNGAVPPVSVRGVNTQNYFIHPVPGSILTQGLHGFNSVDFGAPRGTPILAAADGIVIVSKGDGKWYGGYGNYVVIQHDNGTQTLYSHNSRNLVEAGDVVKQGQQIATIGSTGRSTGPHLHFEVRGGTNPWVGVPKGTKF